MRKDNNMVTAQENAVARIKAIKWGSVDNVKRRKSLVGLLNEYMRRTALWANRLEVQGGWPFIDIATHVCPTVQPEDVHLKEMTNTVARFDLYSRKICQWYLKWCALQDEMPETLAQFDLPEPFEPLIRLYERGTTGIYPESGLLYVAGVGVSTRSRENYARTDAVLSELDDASLDNLDAEFG
jgi:hypothetical protein